MAGTGGVAVSAWTRWCFRRRRLVLALWLGALIGIGAFSGAAGTAYQNKFSLPGTESQHALDLLKRDFPAASGESETIVLHARTGTLRDPGVTARAEAMLARVAKLPHVVSVASPYAPAGARQVSTDATIAFAPVTIDGMAGDVGKPAIKAIIRTAEAGGGGALQVELTGNGISYAQQAGFSSSALIGVLAAAVVLFVAFGSLLAMTLPLISAIVAIGVGTSSIGLISHGLTIAEFGPTLGVLIGLGVGTDYALFIVNRHRTALRAGKDVEEAAVTALNTSGRAVLFAGTTVCIALLGMFALGVSFLYGVAISAALVVALTMASSVTLLPALLGFYGMRVLSRRERARLATRGPAPEEPSGGWWRWARLVERRPRLFAVIGAAAVLALAIPFLSMRLGSSDEGNDPTSSTTRRGYDLLATGFGPGFNGPFTLAAELRSPGDAAHLPTVVSALRTTPGVASVGTPRISPNARAATILVYPTTSPQAAATADLLKTLRNTVIPRASAGSTLAVHVGGITATFEDFAHVLSSKLPLFVAVVVALAFLLLMAVFRSLLVPLTASVMNLLAVGAAFGVTVAVFQWGWGASVLGIKSGPIEAFIPVMLFAILFGLSMDYEVFLVSRIYEEWTARRDNRVAVTLGQAETGRVVSAAATIMVLVFFSFILGDDRVIKLFGLGLGVAVALDAFLVRTILVPALMHLIGRANWWLPASLDRRLPHIAVEASTPDPDLPNPRPGSPELSGQAGRR
jgi:putative drug exporter of the RND superfamily